MDTQISLCEETPPAISSEPLLDGAACQPKTWQMPDTLVIIFCCLNGSTANQYYSNWLRLRCLKGMVGRASLT